MRKWRKRQRKRRRSRKSLHPLKTTRVFQTSTRNTSGKWRRRKKPTSRRRRPSTSSEIPGAPRFCQGKRSTRPLRYHGFRVRRRQRSDISMHHSYMIYPCIIRLFFPTDRRAEQSCCSLQQHGVPRIDGGSSHVFFHLEHGKSQQTRDDLETALIQCVFGIQSEGDFII